MDAQMMIHIIESRVDMQYIRRNWNVAKQYFRRWLLHKVIWYKEIPGVRAISWLLWLSMDNLEKCVEIKFYATVYEVGPLQAA